MSIERERKAFDAWHLKQFKDINDDLNDDEAEHLYQRVYSHEAQDLIRQMEFNAWLSSANREGYKLMLVEPTQEMIDKAVCDTPETPSQDYWHDSQPISDDQAIACYKAMIGAIE